MNILKLKEKSIDFFEYIVAFLIILDCNSIWQNILGNSKFKVAIIVITIILSIFLISQARIKVNYINLYILIVMFLFIYMIIFALKSVPIERLSLYLSEYYIFFPLSLFCSIIYSTINNRFKLCYKISNIIVFLSIISVFFWLLCSVFKFIQFNNTVVINWGGTRIVKGFYNLYYESQYTILFGNLFARNTGIFTEAPMFSACLSIALLIEVFLKKNLSKRNIIILSITILTTMSTAGYVILLICILWKVFDYKNKKNKYIKLFKIIISLFIGVMVIYILLKILSGKMNSNSYNVRMKVYVEQFKIWKANLLFGSGFGNNESGASNAIGVILSDGGIWLASFYLIPFIRLLYIKKNKNLIAFSSGIIWLMITMVFPYSMILIFILSLLYSFLIKKT